MLCLRVAGKHGPAGRIRWQSAHLLSEGFAYILSHSNIKKVVLSHHPRVSWYNVVDTYHPDNKNFDRILHDGFARTYEALTKAGKEIYVILDNPDFGVENWSKCKASVVRRPVAVPAFLNLKNEKACSLKNQTGLTGGQLTTGIKLPMKPQQDIKIFTS